LAAPKNPIDDYAAFEQAKKTSQPLRFRTLRSTKETDVGSVKHGRRRGDPPCPTGDRREFIALFGAGTRRGGNVAKDGSLRSPATKTEKIRAEVCDGLRRVAETVHRRIRVIVRLRIRGRVRELRSGCARISHAPGAREKLP